MIARDAGATLEKQRSKGPVQFYDVMFMIISLMKCGSLGMVTSAPTAGNVKGLSPCPVQ